MPTDIEGSYCEQGYRLAEGLAWEMVAERRRRWAIAEILVPIAVSPGCIGWGVPHVVGKPLKHP